MCYSFEFVESCASLMLLQKFFQDLLAKRGWFMILFFAVFTILSLIEFYFGTLILRGTSGWLGYITGQTYFCSLYSYLQ